MNGLRSQSVYLLDLITHCVLIVHIFTKMFCRTYPQTKTDFFSAISGIEGFESYA